jgi:hypothetical protein
MAAIGGLSFASSVAPPGAQGFFLTLTRGLARFAARAAPPAKVHSGPSGLHLVCDEPSC